MINDDSLHIEMPDFHAEKKKRGRPAGVPNRVSSLRGAGKAKFSADVEAVLRLGNQLICATRWMKYALTEDEIIAMREALVMEAQASPRALRLISRIGALSPHILFFNTIMMIAARRIMVAAMEKQNAGSDTGEAAEQTPFVAPVPVGARPAFNDGGGYGNRQKPTGITPDSDVPAYHSIA